MTGQRSNQLNYVPLKGEASQWWALSDLNGRPFGCKPNALTAELSALTLFMLQEVFKSVNAVANLGIFIWAKPWPAARCDRLMRDVPAENPGRSGPAAGETVCAIRGRSLHFIGAASKLTLLHWCKGNTLGC